MKKIILTCSGCIGTAKPQRFVVEIDEDLNEAQIVNEASARASRDRSASLLVQVGGDNTPTGLVMLAVETAS